MTREGEENGTVGGEAACKLLKTLVDRRGTPRQDPQGVEKPLHLFSIE